MLYEAFLMETLQTFSDTSFKVGNSTNFYSMFENLNKLIKMFYYVYNVLVMLETRF